MNGTFTLYTTEEPGHVSSTDDISQLINYAQDISAALISIVWLVIYIRSFHNCDQFIYRSIVIVTTFYPLGYSIKYVIDFFLIVLSVEDDIVPLDSIQRLCFVVTSQSYYLSMLLKLHYSFEGSVYEVSKRMMYTLSIFLTTTVLLDVTFWVTRGVAGYTGTISKDISFHLNWIRSIFNVVFGSIFMACFVSKLLKLVMINSRDRHVESLDSVRTEIRSSPRDTSRASPTRASVIKKETRNVARCHRQHLTIAVKFALLHGISIVATNIQFSGWTLLNFELIKGEQSIFWFGVIWSWLWNVVLFVNYYTIWLSFPFADRQYRSVCGVCRKCCLKGCSSLVATKIVDQAIANEAVISKGATDMIVAG